MHGENERFSFESFPGRCVILLGSTLYGASVHVLVPPTSRRTCGDTKGLPAGVANCLINPFYRNRDTIWQRYGSVLNADFTRV